MHAEDFKEVIEIPTKLSLSGTRPISLLELLRFFNSIKTKEDYNCKIQICDLFSNVEYLVNVDLFVKIYNV